MSGLVVLLDTSSSMSEMAGSRSRIDALVAVLNYLCGILTGARLFTFDTTVREYKLGSPLLASGGTYAAEAIAHIAPLRPDTLIFVGDGEPANAEAALGAARELRCTIKTFFVGDETNHDAVAFMHQLAWCSSGRLGQHGDRRPERATSGCERDPPGDPRSGVIAMAFDDSVRAKLVTLLGVAVSTDFDGEGRNALLAARKLVGQHNLSLAEALTSAQQLVAAPAANLDARRIAALEQAAFERGKAAGLKAAGDEGPPKTWKLLAERVLRRHAGVLNQFERTFLPSFLSQSRTQPSEPQRQVLIRIAEKCGVPVPP
jgi:hypothetical protein